MARPLNEILLHLRSCIANGSIKTTLIQTEDLAVLCDAADPGAPKEVSAFVEDALKPKPGWKVQSFEYYAAQFLVGAGLTSGDLDGHVRGLAHELRKQYDMGVEHGQSSPERTTSA